MEPPENLDDWVGLLDGPLPIDAALTWAVVPSCGAVVTFTGHARDHSADTSDVEFLDYEAYDEQVAAKLSLLSSDLRARWPMVGRIALLHRKGRLSIGDTAVVVVVSTPHRSEAFEAARYGIDALKATAPIWKREVPVRDEIEASGAHRSGGERQSMVASDVL